MMHHQQWETIGDSQNFWILHPALVDRRWTDSSWM